MSLGIGETLRAARRQHTRTLADAAAETRIRESYLAALEEEDFAVLGGDVYVKGFLRSYARFLGVDPEPLIAEYRRDHERPEDPAASLQSRSNTKLLDPNRPQPPLVAMGVGLLLLLFVVLGIRALANGGDDDGNIPAVPGPAPVSDTASPSPAADGLPPMVRLSPTPGASLPVTPSPSPSLPDEVEVEVLVDGGESWIKVTVDGEVEIEDVQEDGFSRTFTGEESVLIRIGDPSVVRLVVNGEDQGELGTAEVPRNFEFQAAA